MAEASTKSPRDEERSLREILEGFLFYIGLPALTLYPLGFVALCLQMWRDYQFPYSWDFGGFNFGMIWYAASLVPKVVVIGTGVRLLFVSLLACALTMGIASLTFNFLQRRDPAVSWRRRSEWEMMFWRLSFITLLPLAGYIIWNDFTIDSWYDAPFLIAFVALSAAAGTVVAYIRHRGHDRWFLRGLAVAYAGALFAAVSLSALQLPDLPLVEFEAKENAWSERPASEPFVLLSKSSGYWHVYNRTSGLLATPSEEAQVVRHWDKSNTNKPYFESERDDDR